MAAAATGPTGRTTYNFYSVVVGRGPYLSEPSRNCDCRMVDGTERAYSADIANGNLYKTQEGAQEAFRRTCAKLGLCVSQENCTHQQEDVTVLSVPPGKNFIGDFTQSHQVREASYATGKCYNSLLGGAESALDNETLSTCQGHYQGHSATLIEDALRPILQLNDWSSNSLRQRYCRGQVASQMTVVGMDAEGRPLVFSPPCYLKYSDLANAWIPVYYSTSNRLITPPVVLTRVGARCLSREEPYSTWASFSPMIPIIIRTIEMSRIMW